MGTKNLLILFFLLLTGNVIWAQAPAILNLNPTNGVAGTLITVTGTGFNNAQKLTIGGIATVIVSNTNTQLTAMVMPGTTGGNVELTTSGGANTAGQSFTVGNSFYPTRVQGKDLSQLVNAGQALKQSYSVAINADGGTAIVGNPTDNGEVFIYTRTKASWRQQGNKLTATSNDGLPENFGNAVGLSANGNIAIVGAPNDNQKKGAVWVFLRNDNTWQQSGIKLEGTEGNANGAFIGRSAAISADGKTIVAGGFSAASKNAVWVFTQTGTQWQQSALLEVPDGGKSGKEKQPIALSADGNTIAVKGLNASYVFYHAVSGWVAQGGSILGSDQTASSYYPDFQITALALNADGNTLISGGSPETYQFGGAWVFVRKAGQWAQQAKLTPSPRPYNEFSRFGSSVSLSADGNTAAIGMPGYNNFAGAVEGGAVMFFTRSGNTWKAPDFSILYGENLNTPGGSDPGALVDTVNHHQGLASAISADGRVAIAGSVSNSSDGGCPWIFADYKRPSQTITFTQPGPVTYGVPDFDPGATSTNKGRPIKYLVSQPSSGTMVNGKLHITGAGNVSISASQDIGNDFYGPNTVYANITVNKAPLTIKPDDTVRIYQQSNPQFTVKYTGLVNGDTDKSFLYFQVSASAGKDSPPGTYPITAYVQTNNYDITDIKGTLTVIPPPVVLTITGKHIYGEADFVPDATSPNTQEPIIFTSSNPAVATIVNNKIHVIASGTTQITASQATDGYYPAYSTMQPLTIDKAPLYIKADDAIRITATANPTFTVKYTGFINQTDSLNNSISLVTTTTATIFSPPGTYPITVSGGVSANYTLVYQTGILTVISPPITFVKPANVTYGATDFSPVATSLNTTQPITFTSSNPAVATIVNNKVRVIASGTTQITASQATDGYYPAYSITQPLTVDKAQLTITANNQSMFVGDAFPLLTIKYSGFVNGDDSTALITLARIATTATSASPAGTYPIVVSGATSRNYVFTYINGQFTVTNAIPTIASFSPATAIAGTTVTITGTHLDNVTAVKFGNTGAASFTAVSKTTLTAVVAGGSSGNVSVTAPGGTVSLTGFTFMYTLPTSNFVLTTTGTTCNGSDNGSLKITAAQTLNYTATITGNGLNTPYTFTTTKTITNLAPGTYNVCITVTDQPDYKQCYDAMITEPKDLSVYAEVNPNQDQLSLALGGGVNYTIKLNGVQYNTTESSINLPLSLGDNEVEVTTDKLCQGIFKKIFNIESRIIPYPNPFQSALKLNLGIKSVGSVVVEIHDLANGKLVYLKQYANQSGILSLELGELKNHVYSLKLTRDGKENVYKILKQQ
jgi:hypothetical protein